MGADSGSALPAAQRQHVKDNYDHDANGVYVLRAKAWNRAQALHNTGLIATNVRGDGNCFYAALALHRPLKLATVAKVKTAILSWVDNDKNKQDLLNGVYSCMTALSDFDQASLTAVRTHLATNGNYSTQTNIQIAALALRINIKVEDIANPGMFLGDFQVLPSDVQPSRGTVHLLLRKHNQHPLDDSNFVRIGMSDGHFWKVDPAPTSSTRQGNGKGSVVMRP